MRFTKTILLLALLLAVSLQAEDSIVGVKIYYQKRVVKIALADMAKGWAKAPDDDVQVVLIYPSRKQDGKYLADEMHGADFYWWSPTKGLGQTNEIADIPADAVVKRGKWMYPDSAFLKLYNEAHNDHSW
jgi:hypothetical protein